MHFFSFISVTLCCDAFVETSFLPTASPTLSKKLYNRHHFVTTEGKIIIKKKVGFTCLTFFACYLGK